MNFPLKFKLNLTDFPIIQSSLSSHFRLSSRSIFRITLQWASTQENSSNYPATYDMHPGRICRACPVCKPSISLCVSFNCSRNISINNNFIASAGWSGMGVMWAICSHWLRHKLQSKWIDMRVNKVDNGGRLTKGAGYTDRQEVWKFGRIHHEMAAFRFNAFMISRLFGSWRSRRCLGKQTTVIGREGERDVERERTLLINKLGKLCVC